MCFGQYFVIGIHISPHLVVEVMLKEHLATMGVGVLSFPAKLPGTVVDIKLEFALALELA